MMFIEIGGQKMPDQRSSPDPSESPISPEDLKKLMSLLESIKYGSVTLIIQNGKVVLIEKNEKMRLK
jgi:hypothetical protein